MKIGGEIFKSNQVFSMTPFQRSIFLSFCTIVISGVISGCTNPQSPDDIISNPVVSEIANSETVIKTATSKPIEAMKIAAFPEQIDPNCRDGRAKIYDECSDQFELFTQANLRAKEEGKTVLVSYGGEWCLWCHVFDAYIHGEVDKFTYVYSDFENDNVHTRTMSERATRDVMQEAYKLRKFVSENFVIAHIDYKRSAKGDDILAKLGAREHYKGGAPYIFTADANGTYAEQLDLDLIEVTREGEEDMYLGYDRVLLLQQLQSMRAAAQS